MRKLHKLDSHFMEWIFPKEGRQGSTKWKLLQNSVMCISSKSLEMYQILGFASFIDWRQKWKHLVFRLHIWVFRLSLSLLLSLFIISPQCFYLCSERDRQTDTINYIFYLNSDVNYVLSLSSVFTWTQKNWAGKGKLIWMVYLQKLRVQVRFQHMCSLSQ